VSYDCIGQVCLPFRPQSNNVLYIITYLSQNRRRKWYCNRQNLQMKKRHLRKINEETASRKNYKIRIQYDCKSYVKPKFARGAIFSIFGAESMFDRTLKMSLVLSSLFRTHLWFNEKCRSSAILLTYDKRPLRVSRIRFFSTKTILCRLFTTLKGACDW